MTTTAELKAKGENQLQEVAAEVKEFGEEALDQARGVAGAGRFGLRTLAKAYPAPAMLSAVALGLLFGFGLNRLSK